MVTDWDRIRANKVARDAPADWPPTVRAISMEGLSLLGVDERSGELLWDGEKLVTERRVRLGTFERVLAAIAGTVTAGSAFGVFMIELGHAAGWWSAG